MIKLLTLIVFGLYFLPQTLIAQSTTGTLQGKISTSDHQPAQGISVQVTGTKTGAITNADGRYTIKLKPGTYTIAYKALGMLAKQLPATITAGKTTEQEEVTLTFNAQQLKEVVITGQYAAQSLKNSVYMVRTITNQQILMRNAAKIQEVLSDQLGVRFTNDLTLGTSDITLMGVSGQRVKILQNGVPLLDRGDTRESLNQVDINSIDHIEIVEGPMSVSYGSDALGGVINLITKKGTGNESFKVNARIQEETAGKEFQGLDGSGTHLENVGLSWGHKNWEASGNFTRNYFDGARLGWKPKDQLLGNAVLGYRTNNLHVWYRFDGTDETIRGRGAVLPDNSQIDQNFLTNRWMHQLQAEWTFNDRLNFNAAASYTDYSRHTQTSKLDLNTGDRRLTLGIGEQDKSVFDTKFFRTTAQYKLSDAVSLQPGVELNLTGSTGARITGSPTINDYAFFISSEIAVNKAISLRPGLRFNKNSVYDAPPVIPSLNAKVKLNSDLDLRLAYARGYRSPALRELYFNFVDASHTIYGNTNLKAEYSHSTNASLAWTMLRTPIFSIRSSAGAFYNYFDNFITTGQNPADRSSTTYINILKYKTTGGTFDNTLNYKNLQAKVGFSYTGTYNQLQEEDNTLPGLNWYPEANASAIYHFSKIKADVALFYKFNGTLPVYETQTVAGISSIHLAKRAAFHTADLSINKSINKMVSLSGGIKNLFNITNVNNTSTDVGGAHSTGGPVPLGYGRSFFFGLTFQYSKY